MNSDPEKKMLIIETPAENIVILNALTDVMHLASNNACPAVKECFDDSTIDLARNVVETRSINGALPYTMPLSVGAVALFGMEKRTKSVGNPSARERRQNVARLLRGHVSVQ